MTQQNKVFLLLATTFLSLILTSQCCTSFYCINSCGTQSNSRKGYKLILANNRDEDIYRQTGPADVWLPKVPKASSHAYRIKDNEIICDQSSHAPPFNLCVFGPIDLEIDVPPNLYSTWIGMNERGSVGNLLFFLDGTKTTDVIPRGYTNYVQTSEWESPEQAMQDLTDKKHLYLAFNYVQLEMSKKDGSYSLYYVNNNDTKSYAKMNDNTTSSYYFSVSNSNLERPFAKTVAGKQVFKSIIDNYASHQNKDTLTESLLALLQNTTDNMPDENLAAFMEMPDPKFKSIVKGVSSVRANYTGFWYRAHTRTSTIILVDYDNNVEYHELNLTSWTNNEFANNQTWKMNSFKFKLKPLYKLEDPHNNSSPSSNKPFNLVLPSHLVLVIFMLKGYIQAL